MAGISEVEDLRREIVSMAARNMDLENRVRELEQALRTLLDAHSAYVNHDVMGDASEELRLRCEWRKALREAERTYP